MALHISLSIDQHIYLIFIYLDYQDAQLQAGSFRGHAIPLSYGSPRAGLAFQTDALPAFAG